MQRLAYRPLVVASLWVSLWIGMGAAHAQECSNFTAGQAKKVAQAGEGQCDTQCTGCGCKGGPGYRSAKGRCVGYANLISECGPPPHDSKGCQRECFVVIAECQAPGPAPSDGTATLAPASEGEGPKSRRREAFDTGVPAVPSLPRRR
jgi:hypothetical protein